MPRDWSSVVRRITRSITMLKNSADIKQPCLTPVLTSKLDLLFCNLHVKLSKKLWMTWTICCGIPGPWGWQKTILEDAIKGFFEIYKVIVQLSLQFCALLNDVSQGVYLFNASLPFQKPACSLDYDLCQDLAWH